MKHRLYVPLALLMALVAPATPAQVASATSPPPTVKFDVVSFKHCDGISGNRNTEDPPDGDFIARHCQSIHALIDFAFAELGTHQLKNQPGWVDTEGFEFSAKVAPGDVPAWHQTSLGTKRLMLRIVLADSLGMTVHIEQQSRPIYTLVLAKEGPRMTVHNPTPDDPPSATLLHGDVNWVGPDEAAFTNASMADLISSLSARLGRNVVDKTGLVARYDFHVQPLPMAHYSATNAGEDETDFGSIIDAVKPLGLRLEPGKADTSVIVIDHINRPAED